MPALILFMAHEDEQAFLGFVEGTGGVLLPDYSPTADFETVAPTKLEPNPSRYERWWIYYESAGILGKPEFLPVGEKWHNPRGRPLIEFQRAAPKAGVVAAGVLGFDSKAKSGNSFGALPNTPELQRAFRVLRQWISEHFPVRPKGWQFAGPHAVRLHEEGWHFNLGDDQVAKCEWCGADIKNRVEGPVGEPRAT